MKKTTIDEVAKLANVSKTTVSRYINGNQHLISPKTNERIRKAIEETGFRPNVMARNLKIKDTKTIGCIVSDIGSYFTSKLIDGITEACMEKGYQAMFVNLNNQKDQEIKAIETFIDNNVSGIIINTTGEIDDYLINLSDKVPIVIADRYLSEGNMVDTVSSNNYESTYHCLDYLFQEGYDDVYFFQYGRGGINQTRKLRYSAFEDFLEKRNIDSKQYSIMVNNNDDVEMKITEILKKSNNRNIAFFAVNGMLALDIVQVAKLNKFKIGDDFGLCCFDNFDWMSVSNPEVTAIDQDTFLVGFTCVLQLLKKIEDKTKAPELIEIETKLVKRGSTSIKNLE